MSDDVKDKSKVCTGCGETFAATTEFWHKYKLGKYGLISKCKKCVNQYYRQRKFKKYINICTEGQQEKACTKCGESKLATTEFFYRNNRHKSGLKSWCKSCITQSDKEDKTGRIKQYRKDNSERAKKYRKQYYKDNSERIKRYYKDNAQKVSLRQKQYSKDNAGKIKQYDKQYRKDNAEKLKKQHKQYREDNADKLKQYGFLPLLYSSSSRKNIMIYETVRRSKINSDLAEVKCTYCDKWFAPTVKSINNRLGAINGTIRGEGRLYCSDNCKRSCDIYGQRTHRKGTKKINSREVDPLVRKLCFEADDWTCQRCGNTTDKAPLHCHHIKGYAQNKILGNDLDNVITLCKSCHKEVHRQEGCGYHQMRCDYKEYKKQVS